MTLGILSSCCSLLRTVTAFPSSGLLSEVLQVCGFLGGTHCHDHIGSASWGMLAGWGHVQNVSPADLMSQCELDSSFKSLGPTWYFGGK